MKTLPCRWIGAIAIATLLCFGTTLPASAGGRVAAWGNNSYGQCILPNGLNNVKAVAAGSYHALALRTDGTVVGWGMNYVGQSTIPAGLSNVTQIAAGYDHSLALLANGSVVAWGRSYSGLTNVPPSLSGVISIAAGESHSLALKADGTVVAWGSTSQGLTNVPENLHDVVAIAAGSEHSLALTSDGRVVAWGDQFYETTNVPAGLSNVIAIAAGGYNNLALRSDGTVVAWGYDYYGLTNVPPGLNNVVQIAIGYETGIALKSDGTVVTWGTSAAARTVPMGLTSVRGISAGAEFCLAIVPGGPPEILTQPVGGNVGYGSNIVLSATVSGAEPLILQWRRNGAALTDSARISGATNASLTISNADFPDTGTYTLLVRNAFGFVVSTGAVVTVYSPPVILVQPASQIAAAGANLTIAVSATGTQPLRYQWYRDDSLLTGRTSASFAFTNSQPELSGSYRVVLSNVFGVVTSRWATITITDTPPYIITQPKDQSTAIGGGATFSVSARGSLPLRYQWRYQGDDIPSATNSTFALSSLKLSDAGYYSVVVSNGFGATASSKAFLNVSQVVIWGPAGVGGLTNYPAGLTNVVAVSAGYYHMLALRADGTVLAWGIGGALDPRVNPLTNVPPEVTEVVAISTGSSHDLALKKDGRVVAWGYTNFGATNVPTDLRDVMAISAGYRHSLALKKDGTLVQWEYLPGYSVVATNPLPQFSNIVAIAAGRSQDLALTSDGLLIGFGFGASAYVPLGITNIIAIAGTGTGFLGLRADGSVMKWSESSYYQPAPAFVISGISNAVAMAGSPTLFSATMKFTTNVSSYFLALQANGTVLVPTGSIAPPAGISNVIAIAAGEAPGTGGSRVPEYGGNFYAAIAGNGSPFFTIHPVRQSVARGRAARMVARAAGVQPISFQWQLNGTNLLGATTDTLILTNVQPENLGVYRVVASNVLGTAFSSEAALNLNTSLPLALNATNLSWTTGTLPTNSPAPWFPEFTVTHDGDAAAQSGRITNNQQSWLNATVTGPGQLTFWWKVSSEQNYDRLWFSMDALDWATWISGETDWTQFRHSVPAGEHVLRWTYAKDGSLSSGQDAGWLDQVVFTPDPPPILAQMLAPAFGTDGNFVCAARDAQGAWLAPGDLMHFQVQASSNLVNWFSVPGALTLSNGMLQLRDPDSTNHLQRFYRVVEQ